jgi:hypothetical protein
LGGEQAAARADVKPAAAAEAFQSAAGSDQGGQCGRMASSTSMQYNALQVVTLIINLCP